MIILIVQDFGLWRIERSGVTKVGGHGSETFKEGVMNSCNPVFMDVGARVGVDGMYQTFRQLGLFEKTGIDLPGEASSIMHQKKNVGAVELATMSFDSPYRSHRYSC